MIHRSGGAGLIADATRGVVVAPGFEGTEQAPQRHTPGGARLASETTIQRGTQVYRREIVDGSADRFARAIGSYL